MQSPSAFATGSRVGRRYLGVDILARSRVILVPDTTQEVHHTSDLQALTA